jgi:predicted ATPase/class 3 adenylate cyclase
MAAEFPSGTVTFLFTDVENSTELARRSGANYPALISSHYGIIYAAVQDGSGYLVKNTGDGVFAAFSTVSDALGAARAIQSGITAHRWPLGVDLRVRIGLHTGEATTSENDYVGLEVHRAARVMAAGHGGQVLVSGTTRNLANNRYEFLDLGRHLLRGLETEETLYQLVVPGLPQEFPPLKTASVIPNNLPGRLASLIGREDDVDDLTATLTSERLVTLLGPGGVGKTSLALAAARRSIDSFPGGVTFVDLSGVSDAQFVIPTIATELRAEPKDINGVANLLRGRRCLLVLDNLEQVVESAADIGQLMSLAEDAHFLATSQVPLRLSGERRYLVDPLPADGAAESPGIELFLDRARSVAPDFDADPDVIAEIVRAVDGLPLAIELVAARANLLDAEGMLRRLREGKLSLQARSDAADRHRSLEAALDWSYDLLALETRDVFRRLSLFAGGFTLDAAEAIASESGIDVLDQVGELVDRSLLVRRLDAAGRFRMLEGIRRYARLRLDETEERTDAVGCLIEFYCALGEDAYGGLQSDRGHWWRTQIDEELDNIREVLGLLRTGGRSDDGLGLLGNTWRFYASRGYLPELNSWLQAFLDMPAPASVSAQRIKGIMARGAVEYWQERGSEAVASYEDALVDARELGDERLIADALFGVASSLIIAERPGESGPFLEESREIYEKLGDKGGVADVVVGEAFLRTRISGVGGLGDLFAEATSLYEAVGRRVQATESIYAGSAGAIADGRFDDARALVLKGLSNGVELSDLFLQAWGIAFLARIDYELGDLESAGLYAGATEAAREKLEAGWGPENFGVAGGAEVLRSNLGETEAERLIAPGRELTLTDAANRALATVRRHSSGPGSGLSATLNKDP